MGSVHGARRRHEPRGRSCPCGRALPSFILGQHFSHKCFLILVQFVTSRATSKECCSAMLGQGFFADRTSGSKGFVKGQQGARVLERAGERGTGQRLQQDAPTRALRVRSGGTLDRCQTPATLDSFCSGTSATVSTRSLLPVPTLPCSPVFVQTSPLPECPVLSLHRENCWAFKTPPGSPPSGLLLMP